VTALTAKQILFARTHAQGLGGDRPPNVADAVRRVVGLQAQDVRANRLAVRVRTSGLTHSDVDGAVGTREVVRTWAMRGTLHMLAAEDVGWITRLLGPRFAKSLTRRRLQLGLDEETCARGVAAVEAVLAETGPLTRAELVARIADRGVALDPRSQAPAHLVGYAAMIGLVCRGPELDRDEPSYVLVRDWVDEQPRLTEEEGLARLARRYLAGYGPASAEDFAAWSGLPLGSARAGLAAIQGELEPVTAAGERAFRLVGGDSVPAEGRPVVRLLGHFDTYLLGYRGRRLAVPAEFDRRIQSGGGFIMPAVLVDGRAVGTWRQTRAKDRSRVTIEPFTRIPERLRAALRDELDDLGRFLDTSVEWDFPT
jgi:DNA glycosylase AlkZ-like